MFLKYLTTFDCLNNNFHYHPSASQVIFIHILKTSIGYCYLSTLVTCYSAVKTETPDKYLTMFDCLHNNFCYYPGSAQVLTIHMINMRWQLLLSVLNYLLLLQAKWAHLESTEGCFYNLWKKIWQRFVFSYRFYMVSSITKKRT